MDNVKKYLPSFASALLMCGVLYFIYPLYQYYVDPDGVAYLTISKRYAMGDIQHAINGYWSPWACWLTAGLIKAGLEAIPASVVVNAAGAMGFLFISQSFFLRFSIVKQLQWLLNIALALFLCYAVFWQSFDDLWECFFLLATLRLLLAADFVNRPALWIVYGALGTFAYFAKSYSFPFFILNTAVCVYFLSDKNKRQSVTVLFVSVVVMTVCSLPWILALHNKYGIWTTSTAGPLNMSWYLVGHPYWKDGIKVLLPPPYPDSPYYWEDPWYVNGRAPHFWNSWHLFGLQFLRIALNIFRFIKSSLQISVFFIFITGYVKWMALWKRDAGLSKEMRVLMLSFLLFTVGYVLVNFEARYIWYMAPLSMVVGSLYIQRMEPGMAKKLLPYAFALSFVLYPAYGLMKMQHVGYTEHKEGTRLKEMGIRGSFTAYPEHDISYWQNAMRAYFYGMPYYTIPLPDSCSLKDVLDEIGRYHINYLIKNGHTPEIQLPDGRIVQNIGDGKDDFSLFLINP